MSQLLLVISSFPRSVEAQRVFHLAGTLLAQGRAVALVLLQDAVLAAVGTGSAQDSGGLTALVSRGVPVYACEHDLTLRGFAPQDMVPGAQAVNDQRIVDLMLADCTGTLGCF